MPTDDQVPATKKKLRASEKRIIAKMEEIERRLVQHFNVVAENLVHDFQGIFKDRLEQYEDRIDRLGQHAGLTAA